MKRKLTIFFILFGIPALLTGQTARDKFTVHFINGDQLNGRLGNMAAGKLTLYPAIAPNRPMTVDVKRVQRIACESCAQVKKDHSAEILYLRDGSILRGQFKSMTRSALVFNISGLDQVRIPRNAVDYLKRPGKSSGNRLTKAEQYVVKTADGSILIGRLSAGQGGRLRIRGKNLDANFSYASVETISFPTAVKAPDRPVARPGKKPINSVATLGNGTTIYGSNPVIRSGKLSIVLAGGQRLTVAAGRVANMTFAGTGALASSRKLLVWGRFADRYQEYRRTVDIAKEGLKDWKIEQDFSPDFDANFRTKLMKSRTLLIPEMERWRSRRYGRFQKGPTKEVLTQNFRKIALPFLQGGGNIVILCVSRYQTTFLRDAGLLDVSIARNASNSVVGFTPEGRRIARAIGPKFKTSNATTFYKVGTSLKSEAWARNRIGAPIVGRRVGNGWVILMGMDYYAKNKQTAKLLINAITLR